MNMNDDLSLKSQKIEELEREIDRLKYLLQKAIKYSEADPEVFLGQARKTTEAICLAIHRRESKLRKGLPAIRKRATLDDMIQILVSNDLIPKHMVIHLRTIQSFGNYGAHEQSDWVEISCDYIKPCLLALTTFTYWYFNDYLGRPYTNPLARGNRNRHLSIEDRVHLRTVRFIQPFSSRNDFYFDTLSRLTSLVNGLEDWKLVVDTPQSDHVEDMYLLASEMVKRTERDDAVILVARGVEEPDICNILQKIVENCKGKIIFFDQPPPTKVMAGKNCFFVGVDAVAVGFLAAVGLRNLLDDPNEASYLALAGPGGKRRWTAFVDALKFENGDVNVIVKAVEDLDRYSNYSELYRIIGDLDPSKEWGIFAGNDELAFAVLSIVRELGLQKYAIAGCDATKEMRFNIDHNSNLPVCTVDTLLDRQCAKLVQLIQFGSNRQVINVVPELYPPDQNAILRYKAYAELRSGARASHEIEKFD